MIFPGRGQTEITRTGEGSELWTPVKIGAVIGLFLDGAILVLYLIGFIFTAWAKGAHVFWSWFTESFWGWPIMCALMLSMWLVAYGFVILYRLAPEVVNKNWPPTISPIDPMIGMVSAWTNMGKRESALDRAYNRALQEDENDE